MNVLLVSDTYKPQINGVVTALDIQVNSLKKHKINTTLLVPGLKKFNDKHILTASTLPNPLFTDYKIPTFFSLKNLYKIKKLNIDIIHTHTPFQLGVYAIMLSKILKVPIVHTYHTYFEEYMHYVKISQKTGKVIVHLYSKWYCNQMDHVIAPSPFMESKLQSYQIDKKITTIPSGYDLKKFTEKKGANWRKKYKIPVNAKVLLYVGRMGKEKNLYFLINIFQKLKNNYKNIFLILTGDGTEKQRLLKYINKYHLSDSIKMTGFIPYEDIHNIYNIGDIFIFPSKTETQGLVLIEAMLNNLPVVSFYEKGTKSVLPAKKILGISPVNDDKKFIEEIKFYLKNNYDKNKLNQNLKNFVKKFNVEETIKALISLYRKTIKKS